MSDFTPIDMDAKIKECLDIAKDAGARAQGFDRLMLAGAAALALEAWVQVEPDQREALVVKVRADLGAEPHWLVSLTRTTQHGSAHGHHKDSMACAIGDALQTWEQMYGPDK